MSHVKADLMGEPEMRVLGEKEDASNDQISVAHAEANKATSWEGVSFTPEDSKRAHRKVDMFLVTTLTLYFFLSFLDRSNIGNAKVAGMERDLNLTGNQYNTLLSVLFVPYILVEWPSNLLLKKLGPNRVLPTLVFLWGLVTFAQAFTNSFGEILACRFFIGLLEGGLTPGSILIMSGYVRRYDFQKRVACFFGMIQLAGAFSGLLAYAFTSNLEGARGLQGWRWIFLIEGIMTSFLGLATAALIPRSPMTAWWLKPTEKAALLAALSADNTAWVDAKDEKIDVKDAISVVWTNPICACIIVMQVFAGFYSFALAFYIPPIIAGLGYTAVRAQLMTVPPNAVGFVLAIATAFLGDRIRARGPIMFAAGFLGTIGYLMNVILPFENFGGRYAAVYLQVACQGILSPVSATWGSNNSSGHLRRGMYIATAFAGSNIMGLSAVWAFKPWQAPRYATGTALGLASSFIIFLGPVVTDTLAWTLNKRRERALAALPADHIWPDSPVIDDRDIRFRYTL